MRILKVLQVYTEEEPHGLSWPRISKLRHVVPSLEKSPDDATEHMRERAGLMSDISKALLTRSLDPP